MTVSISARCARTGAMGIAIASSSPAVAARCAHAAAGVGVVATQNITDPRLGPRGLALLRQRSAPDALASLVADAPHVHYRQLALVDAFGGSAVFSGEHALPRYGALAVPDVALAGNLLANDTILPAMAAAFGGSGSADLGDRLMAALRAAVAAGGEVTPIRSAGLLVVHEVAWPVVDLRVDWHDDPVQALAELWAVWKPQQEAYVARALAPHAAPAFFAPPAPGWDPDQRSSRTLFD